MSHLNLRYNWVWLDKIDQAWGQFDSVTLLVHSSCLDSFEGVGMVAIDAGKPNSAMRRRKKGGPKEVNEIPGHASDNHPQAVDGWQNLLPNQTNRCDVFRRYHTDRPESFERETEANHIIRWRRSNCCRMWRRACVGRSQPRHASEWSGYNVVRSSAWLSTVVLWDPNGKVIFGLEDFNFIQCSLDILESLFWIVTSCFMAFSVIHICILKQGKQTALCKSFRHCNIQSLCYPALEFIPFVQVSNPAKNSKLLAIVEWQMDRNFVNLWNNAVGCIFKRTVPLRTEC